MTTDAKTRELPMLMNGAMVRATLEGRKTQTRRLVNPQPSEFSHVEWDERRGWHVWWDVCKLCGDPDVWQEYAKLKVPHEVGSRIWCKETFGLCQGLRQFGAFYRASVPAEYRDESEFMEENAIDKWRPSIHMPRWASRITLEVTGVRVERLQEISEEDAKAEGAERGSIPYHDSNAPCIHCGQYRNSHAGKAKACYGGMGTLFDNRNYREGFAVLWDSINSKKAPWASNPYVFVYEFRKL